MEKSECTKIICVFLYFVSVYYIHHVTCLDCSGIQHIPIIIQEIQKDQLVQPVNTSITLTIDVMQQNDSPVIFLTQYGQYILHQDPTEPFLVRCRNMYYVILTAD